jgi:hypothetical protein
MKTSTYPNKQNVAYATIKSIDPETKGDGIEFGVEFALLHIDETILHNEEFAREVCNRNKFGDASARIFNCLAISFCKIFFLPFSRIILCTFNHNTVMSNFSFTDSKEGWLSCS